MWLRILAGGAIGLVTGIAMILADHWLFNLERPIYCWLMVGGLVGFALRAATNMYFVNVPPRATAACVTLLAIVLGTWIGLRSDYSALRKSVIARVSEQSAMIVMGREIEAAAIKAETEAKEKAAEAAGTKYWPLRQSLGERFPNAAAWNYQEFGRAPKADSRTGEFPPRLGVACVHNENLFIDQFSNVPTKNEVVARWSSLPPEEQKKLTSEARAAVVKFLDEKATVVGVRMYERFRGLGGMIALAASAALAYFLAVGGTALD